MQGVKVTEDELEELVRELGLEGDDVEDLVKGLSGGPTEKTDKVAEALEEEADTDTKPATTKE